MSQKVLCKKRKVNEKNLSDMNLKRLILPNIDTAELSDKKDIQEPKDN